MLPFPHRGKVVVAVPETPAAHPVDDECSSIGTLVAPIDAYMSIGRKPLDVADVMLRYTADVKCVPAVTREFRG